MTGLEHAIVGLRQALGVPRRDDHWRRLVHRRIAAVADALRLEYSLPGDDSWLAPRELLLLRERERLTRRVTALGRAILESTDREPVRRQFDRLLRDLEHHRQRLNDLAYDTVALELGGSD